MNVCSLRNDTPYLRDPEGNSCSSKAHPCAQVNVKPCASSTPVGSKIPPLAAAKSTCAYGRRICRVCKAGLGCQSSAEPLGFSRTLLQRTFYSAKPSAEPSCRTPRVPQNSGEEEGARTCLWRTGFFSSQHRQRLHHPGRTHQACKLNAGKTDSSTHCKCDKIWSM